MELVRDHMDDDRRMFEKISGSLDGNGKPGLKTRVELAEIDLKEVKASKTRNLTAIWSVLVAVTSAILIKFIVG